jgi:branched-chain amino acid transport system ATP-binding protein
MLEVDGIHTYYGLSHILFGVSLKVDPRMIVCLLGRNGAGKTTTLRSVIGLNPPREGRVRFRGEDVTGMEPYRLTRRGVSYVPDDRRIFADLSVGENLEIAVRTASPGEGWRREKVFELFPALQKIESRKGGCLSGGEQKMLAIARALMGNPELLLLDEPTEGLAPALVRSLESQVKKLRDAGLTVLLAEQNVKSALRLSDRGYIIDNGQIRYEGSIEELQGDEEVRRKYLLI